jgi:hypothetical protein
MRCEYCSYEWAPRTESPVACPRCKKRFDYPSKKSADDPLAGAKGIERGFQRMLYVMARITPALESVGVKAVVVGGSAVEFYTRDWYATGDIDLAINKERRERVGDMLRSMGFKERGRMWLREDLGLYIEVPGSVSDLADEKILKVDSDDGYVYLIGAEDIILDRLRAAVHWKSKADEEQAVRMMTTLYDEIDWDYLRAQARKDETGAVLKNVEKEAEDARKSEQ